MEKEQEQEQDIFCARQGEAERGVYLQCDYQKQADHARHNSNTFRPFKREPERKGGPSGRKSKAKNALLT